MARMPLGKLSVVAAFVVASLVLPPVGPAAADQDVCDGGDVIVLPNGTTGCTHGPDPVPIGAPQTSWSMLGLAAAPTVACIGDGTSGDRVQALYVVAEDRPNRASEVVPQIRSWIVDVDAIFSGSAGIHGVEMKVRWVHDGDCVADVQTVVVPAGADDDFGATIDALSAAGYGESGRHYLAWVDASIYCGIAVNYPDDRGGQDNLNNGDWPLFARVDRDCWGRDGLVEAHELTHMLGAVQASAPNATANGHCTDEYDIMCYPDGDGSEMTYSCPDPAGELRLDCNSDDYFNPDPEPGSYLADHWNVANSAFLHTGTAPRPPKLVEAVPVGFDDVDAKSAFAADVSWLAEEGITKGCNPPANDLFCPDATVTRGQMAAFLVRALGLKGSGAGNPFVDDDGSGFEGDIEVLAAARITSGCGNAIFCPDAEITRAQMAAFLSRALDLPAPAKANTFVDDNGSVYEDDIERLAAAGITTGCAPDRFCPEDPVTRAQMAAFLHRALTG